MKKIIILIIGSLFHTYGYAQVSRSEQDLLKKYWNYRDRYKKHFVKVGARDGESIPLSLWYKD